MHRHDTGQHQQQEPCNAETHENEVKRLLIRHHEPGQDNGRHKGQNHGKHGITAHRHNILQPSLPVHQAGDGPVAHTEEEKQDKHGRHLGKAVNLHGIHIIDYKSCILSVCGKTQPKEKDKQNRQGNAALSPVPDFIETVRRMPDGVKCIFQFLPKHGSPSSSSTASSPTCSTASTKSPGQSGL